MQKRNVQAVSEIENCLILRFIQYLIKLIIVANWTKRIICHEFKNRTTRHLYQEHSIY